MAELRLRSLYLLTIEVNAEAPAARIAAGALLPTIGVAFAIKIILYCLNNKDKINKTGTIIVAYF